MKTFLLGAGAQKAGTTWLHDYLTDAPECAAPMRKEYHVYDVHDLPGEQWLRDRIAHRAARAARSVAEGRPKDVPALLQAAMVADPQVYVDHVTGLLHRDQETRLATDLTPDYALLSGGRFASIRTDFAARGVRTVAVHLMRDPVDRIWSQIRMQKQRRPEQYPEPAEDLVRERYAEPQYADRTRYDVTLAALDTAFPADDLYVGFYEELFTAAEVRRVCDLVGIAYREPGFDTRANAAPREVERLPEETARVVAEHFRPVYDAVAERCGGTTVERLWPSSRLLHD
jgi:hypothetical protein